MAAVLSVTNHWDDTKRIHVVGSIVLSGNYTTGGDALAFGLYPIKSASAPLYVEFNCLSKYLLRHVFGTTINNPKLKIIVPDTGLELAQAAYPGALTGDTINFYAIFPKNQ